MRFSSASSGTSQFTWRIFLWTRSDINSDLRKRYGDKLARCMNFSWNRKTSKMKTFIKFMRIGKVNVGSTFRIKLFVKARPSYLWNIKIGYGAFEIRVHGKNLLSKIYVFHNWKSIANYKCHVMATEIFKTSGKSILSWLFDFLRMRSIKMLFLIINLLIFRNNYYWTINGIVFNKRYVIVLIKSAENVKLSRTEGSKI